MPNNERPHVLILPEDKAFAEMANGFLLEVDNDRQARVEKFGGGKEGLRRRVIELLPSLGRYLERSLVVLFDGDRKDSPLDFWAEVQAERSATRVFFVWTRAEAEDLRREFMNAGYLVEGNHLEGIGKVLATDCRDHSWNKWACEQLTDCHTSQADGLATLREILFN